MRMDSILISQYSASGENLELVEVNDTEAVDEILTGGSPISLAKRVSRFHLVLNFIPSTCSPSP